MAFPGRQTSRRVCRSITQCQGHLCRSSHSVPAAGFPGAGCPAWLFIRRGPSITASTVLIDGVNMNTSTLLSRPFLLVVVLAVSWAAAVPLQDTGLLQDIHSETQLQEYLENNPSVALQMYPDLLREASEVMVVVDPDVVVEMLRRRSLEAVDMQEQQQQEEEEEEEPQKGSVEEEEEEHDRRKRQATFGFGMNRGPYGRNYHASAGYNRRFNNGRTAVGVNAHRNWGSSGKSHGLGISFSHRFRR
ncbi:uncharacterized protein LOC127004598 isoform X2 [Eriocheir sinensis]|uniref:uncharacterized protein LOC127004598 isoform X2 n=1 Tax=Eriocheir sinensis TaxID=95602 RepID=UPI0021C9FCB7|nr:uncharacterized protein LOC127004598 isoform X2 [Eriocheir sinensis]